MSDDVKLAREKMEKLNALLADLEAGKDVDAAAAGVTAKRGQDLVETPIQRFGAISCSGCGCFCFSTHGAGHGCGEHAGHWA
ncbi:MAG: hypothetical protein QNJ16_13625 [Rhodobacter sp.]|nr:hypothetical protein [Rhodobacter sp.]